MKNKFSRRSFLSLPGLILPALVPPGVLNSRVKSDEHRFHYDHILGTSLDLAVWSPTSGVAERIAQASLNEVERLSRILSTRNPESEISRLDRGELFAVSPELCEIIQVYRYWQIQSGGILSIRPLGTGAPLNVDALGKAYIIDRAAAAARRTATGIDGLLLNIGGDIVVWGRNIELGIADPAEPQDNAEPLTHIAVQNRAVATSGSTARGAHFIDGRSGRTVLTASCATVVARDAVTANALAAILCIADAESGMEIVERSGETEALRIDRAGGAQRTSGFSHLERFRKVRQTTTTSNWPMGYEVSIAVTLKPIPRGEDAPYLAAWVETAAGKLVRAIVLWGSKSKYHSELSSFWTVTGGSESLLYKVTRVTRLPGSYKITWNGLDNDGKPAPMADYRIVIETNRYHGSYGKQSGMIACKIDPASATLSGTSNFEPITIQYGPKPTAV